MRWSTHRTLLSTELSVLKVPLVPRNAEFERQEMFNHSLIQTYAFEDIPLNRDIFMMAEQWMAKYERALIKSVDQKGPSAYKVGYYAYAAARTGLSGILCEGSGFT